MKITDYELCDLGIEHSQYFQGFGSYKFEHAYYGIGSDAREALDDCLEQIASSGFELGDLEARIVAEHGPMSDTPSVESYLMEENPDEWIDESGEFDGADCELYYHVGIRFNAIDIPDAPETALDAHTIAARARCHYTGDVNPINHDGTFYDPRDWEAYGYANCVRFTRIADDGDALLVECATINKPADLAQAFKCAGIPDDERDNVQAQIEACLAYSGAETDEDFSGPYVQRFAPDADGNIDENLVWNSVRAWIANLGD